jgi:hypothetical protein
MTAQDSKSVKGSDAQAETLPSEDRWAEMKLTHYRIGG